MTISPDTPGPPYDEGTGRPGARRGLPVPGRAVLLGALIVVVLIVTSTGSTRNWWAHRLHDLTGGSRPADYVIGLVVGLLPVIGVALGAFRARGARRVFRMLLLGGCGFITTYLLSPSPARYLSDRSTGAVFNHLAPDYLIGVFTGAMVWLALLVVAVVRARAAWRRFTRRGTTVRDQDGRGSSHKVIDI